MEEIKKKLFAAEDAHKEWFEEISRTVFQHPELGDREFFSSQYLAELTAERGLHTAVGLFHPEARLPHLVGQIL